MARNSLLAQKLGSCWAFGTFSSSLILSTVLALTLSCRAGASAKKPSFIFHAPLEPASVDPAQLSSTDASYIFSNLYRGLYFYHAKQGLRTEGAQSCVPVAPFRLRCQLNPDMRWSDGKSVVAQDYVRAFRHLVSANSKSLGIELLASLNNAGKIFAGQAKPETLGVIAPSETVLEFHFEKEDPDFLLKLTSPILAPRRFDEFLERKRAHEQAVFNGPYQIDFWQPGKRLHLRPNPHYFRGHAERPPVEVIFVEEDTTALNLYEQNQLSFLRRLPSTHFAAYRNRPDFLQIPVARFDYIGFGPELASQPELLQALVHSLDFRELKIIYDALGIPGCPGLPNSYFDGEPCVRFDLKRAQQAWSQVSDSSKKRRLDFSFSKAGGDDIKKGAEWVQGQWLKHLKLRVELRSFEQAMFLHQLRTKTPLIFRKGLGLDRPSCLSALEAFVPGGSEDFLKIQSPALDAAVKSLQQRDLSEAERRRICAAGIQALLATNRVIPLGQIHFTILARPEFRGWHLNEMNQLDLADLHLLSTANPSQAPSPARPTPRTRARPKSISE